MENLATAKTVVDGGGGQFYYYPALCDLRNNHLSLDKNSFIIWNFYEFIKKYTKLAIPLKKQLECLDKNWSKL